MNIGDSKIFVPHRAIGHICEDIPFDLKYNRRLKRYDIVIAKSKIINLYKLNGLRLVNTSKPFPNSLNLLACNDSYIFVSTNNIMYAINLSYDNQFEYIGHTAKIHIILPFGLHVVTVDVKNNVITWDIHTREIYSNINFDISFFKIACLCHPNTYLNKILFGSEQGSFQLWNIKTNKLIHKFKGWDSSITNITQSPIIDIMGIGLKNGAIYIHNLKIDATLMKFQQNWGPVELLSFRTDGSNHLLSGSFNHPDLAIWDLNATDSSEDDSDDSGCKFSLNMNSTNNLVCLMKNVHSTDSNCRILSAKFIPFSSILVTCSNDNSLKVWNFDRPDGSGILLHSREGHKGPLKKIRFFASESTTLDLDADHNKEYILSIGFDGTFRKFSLNHEGKNKSFGLRSVKGKKFNKTMSLPYLSSSELTHNKNLLPPIIDFDSKGVRQKEWDDTVCVHFGFPHATTWSSFRNTIGAHVLKFDLSFYQRNQKASAQNLTGKYIFEPNSKATCCTITECGNFALIGHENGRIDKFNMQSGIFRGSYIPTLCLSSTQENSLDCQNVTPLGPVNFIQTDSFTRVLISGYGNSPAQLNSNHSDNKIKLYFWSFKTRKLLQILEIVPPAVNGTNTEYLNLPNSLLTKIYACHKSNGLLALALRNNSIAMVDTINHKLVRYFLDAHTDIITDLGFRKQDCQWLYSCSMDGTFKTWDIPSGCLIDVLNVDNSSCPSHMPIISFDTSYQHLVTGHLNDKGMYVWTDVTPFQYVELVSVTSNSTTSKNVENKDSLPAVRDKEEFISLSHFPLHYTKTLLNLDAMRLRNKGNSNNLLFDRFMAQKDKMGHIPFYLGSLTNQDNKFGFDNLSHTDDKSSRITNYKGDSNMNNLMQFSNVTPFISLLIRSHEILNIQPQSNTLTTNSDLLSLETSSHANHDKIKSDLIEKICSFGPSQADTEIRLLSPLNQIQTSTDLTKVIEGEAHLIPLKSFINFLKLFMLTKSNYEIVQLYMSLLIKYHFQTIISDKTLLIIFKDLEDTFNRQWTNIEKQILTCIQLIDTFSNPTF